MAKIDGMDGDENEETEEREAHDEHEEFGSRKVVRKHDPRLPSEQEWEEHEMTHLPFRNWCKHCVLERGREEDCRQTMEEGRQVPEFHLDYMFMEDEKEGKTLALLVSKERETRAVLSTVVSRQTTGGMDMSETDGVASRDWAGIGRHHREVGQRTGVDKFDCVMEHDESDDERIEDDRCEQQFEEQRNCREGDPVLAGNDQNDSQ